MPLNHNVKDKKLLAIRPDGSELYGAWVRREAGWEYETWVEGVLEDENDETQGRLTTNEQAC